MRPFSRANWACTRSNLDLSSDSACAEPLVELETQIGVAHRRGLGAETRDHLARLLDDRLILAAQFLSLQADLE